MDATISPEVTWEDAGFDEDLFRGLDPFGGQELITSTSADALYGESAFGGGKLDVISGLITRGIVKIRDSGNVTEVITIDPGTIGATGAMSVVISGATITIGG